MQYRLGNKRDRIQDFSEILLIFHHFIFPETLQDRFLPLIFEPLLLSIVILS